MLTQSMYNVKRDSAAVGRLTVWITTYTLRSPWKHLVKDPLVFGFALIAVDIALWRGILLRQATIRLLLRLLTFGLFSWLLFNSDMSPFAPAPWPQEPLRHVPAQMLEILWWLNGARLVTMSLDAAFATNSWHKERLFQDVLGAVVFLAAIIASLAFVLNISVRGLAATSGALAIVLGLAIQSTLSDVFAGIVLNTTEPFHIGNWVSLDGIEGTVMEMNWRATHLLNAKGNIVIVPNSVAVKTSIVNSSRPATLHGISIALEISPEKRPAHVVDALKRAILGLTGVLDFPESYAVVKSASANSIKYEVMVYIDDLGREDSVTNDLYDLCYRHLTAAGIELLSLNAPERLRPDVDKLQRLLGSVELFRTLPSEELAALSTKMSRHVYHPEQVVASADAISDYLLIIESGVVTANVVGNSGPVEYARLGPGDAVGEASVLAGIPFRATLTALTVTVAHQLNKDDLTPILQRRPELGRHMCSLLSQRQDSLTRFGSIPQAPTNTERTLLDWLRYGMTKLHDLSA
jgi:small-conductance mechanosensitive channel/CRP-like cAMP-binding protein